MGQDSMGQLATHSEFSGRSLTGYEKLYEKLKAATGEPITPTVLGEQLQRLAVVYGEPKGRTQESAALMAKEWFNALRAFGSKTLARSVTKAIRTLKWWPSLAEIVALCREERESWEDAIGVGPSGGQKPFKEPKQAELTAAEVSKRAADVLKWKQQYGLTGVDEIRIGEDSETKASQDMTVSSALLRTCLSRRARGLPTCSETCSRTNCDLKDCEA